MIPVWFDTTLFDRFLQSRWVHKHGWWTLDAHQYSILLPNMPSSDSAIEGLETSARPNDVALVRGCAVEALGITTSPVFAWILPFGKDEDLCGRDHKARVWLTKIDDGDRFKTGKFFAVFVFGDKGRMHPLISGAHLYDSNLVLPAAAMLQCQEVEHSGCQTSDNIVQYDFQKIRFHFCWIWFWHQHLTSSVSSVGKPS